jgi:predicted negative regulator of RcsB-dependent stress response
MAEDYLTDDEQLENLKRFAVENGPAIIGGIVVALAIVFGYRFYQNHRDQQALAAAAQWGAMATALGQDDRAKTRQLADALIKDYPSSPYADQARLALARLAIDAGQDANAVAPLTEVMNGSKDEELRHIARLRLARVQIDQGKPDEAIQTLSDPPGTFAARYHEVRGDAYFAKNDLKQALAEYQTALAASTSNGMDAALLTLKIADLGAPPAPPLSLAASKARLLSPASPSNKAQP